jgi:hypothetical protein
MTKFTENLWRDLAREHGPALAHANRPEPGRVSLLRHPRVLAGSTLGLAGAGTAVALVLTAAGSTPAFAVTRDANGSVLVTISQRENIIQANAKLTAMGIDEQVNITIGTGPAPTEGAVSCASEPGVSGPPLKVLLGKDGTEVIEPGTTGDNTGVGTWHLISCKAFKTGNTGPGTGNSGTGNSGTGPTVASPAA